MQNKAARNYGINFFDRSYAFAVAIYLSISGLYWIPFISPAIINNFKIIIFLAISIIGIIRFNIYSNSQLKIILLIFICSIAAFTSLLIYGYLYSSMVYISQFIYPLLWLIGLSGMRPESYQFFLKVTTVLALSFMAIAAYPILAYSGVAPDFPVPVYFFQGSDLYDQASRYATVSNSGFAASRTGWGVVVPPMAMLSIALVIRGARITTRARLLVFAIMFCAIATVMVTGARGGVAALVVAGCYGIAAARRGRTTTIFSLLLVGTIISSMGILSVVPETIFRRIDFSGNLFVAIDNISAGRLTSYMYGIEYWKSSPIFGVGPGNAVAFVNNSEIVSIHNVWIRSLAEFGIILFIPFIILTYLFIKLIMENNSIHNGWPNVRPVIVCGLTLGLVEPQVIFGSFNANAVFWTSVWIILNERRMFKYSHFYSLPKFMPYQSYRHY